LPDLAGPRNLPAMTSSVSMVVSMLVSVVLSGLTRPR
jgi:hypothetical protein